MTKPLNTSGLPPELHLVGMLGEGYIERQEATGQAEMVLSDVLPVKIGYDESEEDYEALGIKLGAVIDADPIFRDATLPEGWSRHGTDHSMWSYIADESGRERIAIFYKAAFYDRRANMRIVRE